MRISDHLNDFRMIRLAVYIWESQELDRRHVPPISESIRAVVETNKATYLRRNESEYSPRTCLIGRPAGGTLCPYL